VHYLKIMKKHGKFMKKPADLIHVESVKQFMD